MGVKRALTCAPSPLLLWGAVRVKRFEPFQNLNGSNKFKTFQTLTDPKSTFPYLEKLK
jgi:hypothetical protein